MLCVVIDIFMQWYMLELIAKRFCEVTKEELESLIAKKYTQIDVKVCWNDPVTCRNEFDSC